MGIAFWPEHRVFQLETRASAWQMYVDELGYVEHTYYGSPVGAQDMRYLCPRYECSFSGNPYEKRSERRYSLDTLPQEYATQGQGDFRLPCIEIMHPDGSRAADFRYVGHRIEAGKTPPTGLPGAHADAQTASTLVLCLRDDKAQLSLELVYGVLEDSDVITRAVSLRNDSAMPVRVEALASACLELPHGRWDLLHFPGRHCAERLAERVAIPHGITSIASSRGLSSHQHNPFVIVCDRDCTEDTGVCYGAMLVYSGSFEASIERDQMEQLRLVMGLPRRDFCYWLEPGETLASPEVLFAYSHAGLGALSDIYHRAIRAHICRSVYTRRHRPVLINCWETCMFDVRQDRLLALAREAADLGCELFVLDDGWFTNRHNDDAGLGDWQIDYAKLPDGLHGLATELQKLGLQMGLWIEPECVSEDSQLYRDHPDWVLANPGCAPVLSRGQLVLDFTRQDVQDLLFEKISALLAPGDISYIKWDMNRCLTNLYSHALPPERQGEVGHRYVLGLYALLERITTAYPQVLFEGCAGGGGRFDAGMLYYCPQIWCSDDTDPIERVKIQHGTTYGYPLSSIGSHISISPNQQTGRSSPMATRGALARAGVFGLELDLTALCSTDKEEIRAQIAAYRADEALLHEGRYYRLTSPGDGLPYAAWQVVSRDGRESFVQLVILDAPLPNAPPLHLRLRGLESALLYTITEDGGVYTGAALCYGGYTFPRPFGDRPVLQLHLWAQET